MRLTSRQLLLCLLVGFLITLKTVANGSGETTARFLGEMTGSTLLCLLVTLAYTGVRGLIARRKARRLLD
jgi:hypothetical protein